MNAKSFFKKMLKDFDLYLGTIFQIIILLLLTVQVFSRYVLSHSFTWTEEAATAMFVWFGYFCISAAVTYRKHIRIDAFLDILPFKAKKVMLIVDDLIFIGFNTYLLFPYYNLMTNLGDSTMPLTGIRKTVVYAIIPIMLTVTSVRLVLDIIRTCKETEENLGAAEPVIDIKALEEEAKNRWQQQ